MSQVHAEPPEAHASSSADDLPAVFAALAHPGRLALLRSLRTPSWLSEIRVTKPGADADTSPISRQATKEHIERLIQAGLVVPLGDEGDGRRGPRYVINHRSVYSLAETVRELSRLRADKELGGSTVAAPKAYRRFDIRPQALVMIKGPDEGKVYTLDPPGAGTVEWIIGRHATSDIPLDHDAFVSGENTRITWDEGAYFVTDLPESKNGTRLNFHPLTAGEPERLRTGDLLTVGRTILMFRA